MLADGDMFISDWRWLPLTSLRGRSVVRNSAAEYPNIVRGITRIQPNVKIRRCITWAYRKTSIKRRVPNKRRGLLATQIVSIPATR